MVGRKASEDIVRAWVGKRKSYQEERLLCSWLFTVMMVHFIYLQVGMEVAPHLKESLNKNFFDFLLTFKQVGEHLCSSPSKPFHEQIHQAEDPCHWPGVQRDTDIRRGLYLVLGGSRVNTCVNRKCFQAIHLTFWHLLIHFLGCFCPCSTPHEPSWVAWETWYAFCFVFKFS